MNILLLGSGGREHAFARQLSSSPLCKKLYIAPGNAGTALVGENIAIGVTDFPKCRRAADAPSVTGFAKVSIWRASRLPSVNN